MELQDYVAIVRRRWVTIAVSAALGIAVAVGLTLALPPVYRAGTQLYVSVQGGSSTSDLLQGANFTRQQVSSYTRLVTSPRVLDPVIDDLGLSVSAAELEDRIAGESPLNTSIINIVVSDQDPESAAAIANAVAQQFQDVISEIETPSEGGPSAVRISIMREAAVPETPYSPSLKRNLALGLLVGVAVGVGLAVLREVLNTRVRHAEDVAKIADVPVIGSILQDEDASAHPIATHADGRGPRAESFRRLRTNLQFLDAGEGRGPIVITSSLPGEGKTTTSLNLAVILAEAGMRVLLIDADLRRPALAPYMGLEGNVGLTTVLIGRATFDDVVQPFGNGYLHVLPSGQIPPNPSELLGSSAMTDLLASVEQRYDIVLIDTPPLLPVTDAAVLARLTSGAIVVVGADKLHRNQLTQSLASLETVDARVLGIVINREARKDGEAYMYYGYVDAAGADTTRTRGGRKGGRKGGGRRSRPATPPVGRVVEPEATSEAMRLWPRESLSTGVQEPARHTAQHQRVR